MGGEAGRRNPGQEALGRAGRPPSKWLGVDLMLYPYAIAQTWLLYVVGAALCVGVYIDRD